MHLRFRSAVVRQRRPLAPEHDQPPKFPADHSDGTLTNSIPPQDRYVLRIPPFSAPNAPPAPATEPRPHARFSQGPSVYVVRDDGPGGLCQHRAAQPFSVAARRPVTCPRSARTRQQLANENGPGHPKNRLGPLDIVDRPPQACIRKVST